METILLWLANLLGLKSQNLVGGTPRSSRWPKVRKEVIEEYGECAACGGKDSLEVHHCVPYHVDGSLELDKSNLLVLCQASGHNCHFVFGHFHNWKKHNPRVREMVAEYRKEHDRAS